MSPDTVSKAPPGTAESEVGPLAAGEGAGLAARLDLWLRPGSAFSAADDLPFLVGADAGAHRVVVREGGQPVSHGALYVHRWRSGELALRVGVIGAVATAPEARERGHASRVIRALLAQADQDGLDVVVLWSEVPGFYERHGFVQAGQEVIHPVERELLERLPLRGTVRPMRRKDLPAVIALHAAEPAGPLRDGRHWAVLAGLPGTAWYVLEDRSRIEAYGVVGRGEDLQGCLHEWGGEETALPILAAGILDLRTEPHLYVMSAPWKATARNAMGFHGIPAIDGVLGMIRIRDPAALAEKTGHPGLADTQDPAEAVRRLFGDRSLPGAVPLYFFGLDSM